MDELRLEQVFLNCNLEWYPDKGFAKAVKLALTDMWYSDCTSVNGMKLRRELVRARLEQLNFDCLERVEYALGNYAEDMIRRRNYLKTCLYNSPLDDSTDHAAVLSAFRMNYTSLAGRN